MRRCWQLVRAHVHAWRLDGSARRFYAALGDHGRASRCLSSEPSPSISIELSFIFHPGADYEVHDDLHQRNPVIGRVRRYSGA